MPKTRSWPSWLLIALMFVAGVPAYAQEMKDVEHPFLLWTKDEAAAIRKRIETDPMAKKQLENMKANKALMVNDTMWDLFQYMVLEDKEAGARQKAALIKFIGTKPQPMTWNVDVKKLKWNEGMPSGGDRHQRDEQTLNVLRYDIFFHELSPEQRKGVEQSFKHYIEFHLDGGLPRHPAFRYDRTSWLPNMHWPRPIGTHLMAVALKDPKLIKAMFESDGGWKWYFDEYIADGRFYMEEFGKYYSNIGSMLTYCEGLRRLGLDQYGYGYTGKNGATMEKFLKMLITIGLPRLEAPAEGTPGYPIVTMGDAGDLHYAITGYGRKDRKGRNSGGERWWSTAHMNGPLPKMQLPLWYEIGHRRFPDAGFDYFLAQLHKPGEDVYLPTLYYGLGPIDVKEAKPPSMESYVAPQRGFALLRAEESPDYWESGKPAVALQFARYYVHYVHDCFAILQFVAKNRMIYCRMGRPEGRKGYAGGDPWKDHVRGHNGVVVDGAKAQPVARGDDGTQGHRHRKLFAEPVKFAAVRAAGVYDGVDMERALALTDEYMLDVYWLRSNKPRLYDWQVLAFGGLTDVDAGGKSWTPLGQWKGREARRAHLHDTQVLDAKGDDWAATVLQPDLDEPRKVGVNVHMLGGPETLVLASRPPGVKTGQGVSILASRKAPSTVFAALHVPYEGGAAKAPVKAFKRIAQNEQGLFVAVTGPSLNDRLCLRYGDDHDKPLTLQGNGERVTFTDFAHIRITDEQVVVTGNVTALAVKVEGTPKLTINGKAAQAVIKDGVLGFDASN